MNFPCSRSTEENRVLKAAIAHNMCVLSSAASLDMIKSWKQFVEEGLLEEPRQVLVLSGSSNGSVEVIWRYLALLSGELRSKSISYWEDICVNSLTETQYAMILAFQDVGTPAFPFFRF